MAEKRRLSTRERREPAAKRRASEAPAQNQPPARKKGSTPVVLPPPTPEPAEEPLPTKIKDGEGLPTLRKPQPSELSDKEYQSVAESAVLLASLERSKKKWLSDGILVKYWTKPKKTKRDQIEGKNPPKESMSKVGPCNIVVGPHLFDAMIYTVKDPNAAPPIQYTPPQRPMVHYGHPGNFQPYQPYPTPPPPPHARPASQYPPTQNGPRQPGYPPGGSQTPIPNQQPRAPQPNNRPPPPAQQPMQQHQGTPSQPPQPPKPSPDPVIQMLATRAAADPELKALMRIVASSKASQEQLRAFQAHIDELNAIIKAREQQQQRQQPAKPQQGPQQAAQTPPQKASQKVSQKQQPKEQQHEVEVQIPAHKPTTKKSAQPPPAQSPQSTSAPNPPQPAQIKKEPGNNTNVPDTPVQKKPSAEPTRVSESSPAVAPSPAPTSTPAQPSPAMRPPPNAHPQSTPGPQYQQFPQNPYQGTPPPIQSRPPQYGSPAPYYRPAAPPPPPRINYKSVVFEFTSPLTPYGSSTSGHAGSGDRYLFPEYSILEWLPGGTTLIASFLLVRKVDPSKPFPIETVSDLTTARAKGKASKSKKADKGKGKDKEKSNEQSTANPEAGEPSQQKPGDADSDKNDTQQPPPATPGSGDAKDNSAKEGSRTAEPQPTLKEYYQPVTFRIISNNPKVLEPLTRVVKPPDEVRRYMNEIMDRAERAPDGFLAFRLPRETPGLDTETEEKKAGTPVPAVRTNRSRGKSVAADEDSGVENNSTPGVLDEKEEEEEELKDFYGPVTGLVPLGV
ncbi:hypothetical protein ASPZODRAFT_134700 [Penicilliopsis zonata CBS 506.65]|uniref:SWR1-complex protein 3 domain-containing protein n=1 Tax=Penicilliopsis zonata CBS 506.65 TaxID=1073090 RepID=A0A1L9SBW4_9EURO|nr:hypothetical protein ASPZODRAFT_134700 [Penicilliopsis zonata CBS 506.65]OJJ44618.1 hypothetical protein ASPZODRAFT_134700 [Penicilliopsis zonata CBS 506.65]